jgi:hypothetical protein
VGDSGLSSSAPSLTISDSSNTIVRSGSWCEGAWNRRRHLMPCRRRGCSWGAGCWDPLPTDFRVANETNQTIVLQPRGNQTRKLPLEPKRMTPVSIVDAGCESSGWVATTTSGVALAEIPGACVGHTWTIRGPNDSTYE